MNQQPNLNLAHYSFKKKRTQKSIHFGISEQQIA
jgi:hypothetical protein